MVGSQVLQAVDLSVIWPSQRGPISVSDSQSWYLRKTRSHLALSGGALERIRLTGQEETQYALNYFALLRNRPYLPQSHIPNTFDLIGESFLDPGVGRSCHHGCLSCSFS